MILFPNAKINIGLAITDRRPDGYHNIQSVFLPIGLSDILEVVPSGKPQTFSLQHTGMTIDGEGKDNLVVRALECIRQDHEIPPVDIHLHKCIPPGSGLGGGSSDAVFMVRALDRLFNLDLSKEQLKHYVRNLGSDCSFFLENSPCLVGGVGDEVMPIELRQLSGYWLVLVIPKLHILTSMAYSLIRSRPGVSTISEWSGMPVRSWRNLVINDFEKPLFKKYPLLEKIKSDLYEKGAAYASLSGSGSSVYGLFPEVPDLYSPFNDALVWSERLRY